MLHLTPTEAQALLEREPQAVLIDVRRPDELEATGTPAAAQHVLWTDAALDVNPHFVAEVERLVGARRERPVLLICRSGVRSVDAGELLEAEGFTAVANVLHGVEGDPDETGRRGRRNGWLKERLPLRAVLRAAA
jgi:rhodanese-related sulfurtransferase